MGIAQSILFKAGCKFYNWKNKRGGTQQHTGSPKPSSRGQHLVASPLDLANAMVDPDPKPVIYPTKHQQIPLPFKPVRFREPYVLKRSKATPTNFYLIEGESHEDRRQRLYGMGTIHPKNYTSCADTTSCSSIATWD